MQASGIGYFQSIIVNGNAKGTAGGSIIPMANGIGQGLAQCLGRVERIVNPFEQVGHNAASYWKVLPQKALRLGKKIERVSVHLLVIFKLVLCRASKASHPEQALRVIRLK